MFLEEGGVQVATASKGTQGQHESAFSERVCRSQQMTSVHRCFPKVASMMGAMFAVTVQEHGSNFLGWGLMVCTWAFPLTLAPALLHLLDGILAACQRSEVGFLRDAVISFFGLDFRSVLGVVVISCDIIPQADCLLGLPEQENEFVVRDAVQRPQCHALEPASSLPFFR